MGKADAINRQLLKRIAVRKKARVAKKAEAFVTRHSMPVSDHELKNRIAFLYQQGGRSAVAQLIRDCGFSEQRVEQALRFFP